MQLTRVEILVLRDVLCTVAGIVILASFYVSVLRAKIRLHALARALGQVRPSDLKLVIRKYSSSTMYVTDHLRGVAHPKSERQKEPGWCAPCLHRCR